MILERLGHCVHCAATILILLGAAIALASCQASHDIKVPPSLELAALNCDWQRIQQLVEADTSLGSSVVGQVLAVFAQGATNRKVLQVRIGSSEWKQVEKCWSRWTKSLRKRYPENMCALFLHGLTLEGANDAIGAIKAYSTVVAAEPDFFMAYAFRGRVWEKEFKEFSKALGDYSEAVRCNPEYAEGYLLRAKLYSLLGNLDSAIVDFTRALACTWNMSEAHAYRGRVYLQMERYDEAISDFNEALSISPKYAWALHCRGVANSKIGQDSLAIADFSAAVESDSFCVDAYYNRALLYKDQNRPKKALEDFSRVLMLRPGWGEAYIYKADMCEELELFDEALQTYETFLREAPNSYDGLKDMMKIVKIPYLKEKVKR